MSGITNNLSQTKFSTYYTGISRSLLLNQFGKKNPLKRDSFHRTELLPMDVKQIYDITCDVDKKFSNKIKTIKPIKKWKPANLSDIAKLDSKLIKLLPESVNISEKKILDTLEHSRRKFEF